MSDRYREAGVDLQSGYESIERIKKHIATTASLGFSGDIGGFGGLFELFRYRYKNPVLVSGTDGVGTKLLLAIQHRKIDNVGIDLVAMCVNDILTVGAEPLFFLDYIAVGKNDPQEIERLVASIAEGCRLGSLSLIGGETAEMPDMYAKDHFDLAGFAVGVVESEQRITGEAIAAGDVLIGIPSSGVHSNGFSLVRKIIRDTCIDVQDPSLLDLLLEPTRIYVEVIRQLKAEIPIHGMSHITGGGFYENLPRMLPPGDMGIDLDLTELPIPKVFDWLMEKGNLILDEMYHVFNMGIGFVVVVDPFDVDRALEIIRSYHPQSQVIGTISKQRGLRIR
jgi:phosphoribosylformylglycinamidine cyclo-ligase